MPEILFFPYFGPNRHSDKRVIEFRLDFSRDDTSETLTQAADIRELLPDAGILNEGELFPTQSLPEERMSSYSSMQPEQVIKT